MDAFDTEFVALSPPYAITKITFNMHLFYVDLTIYPNN